MVVLRKMPEIMLVQRAKKWKNLCPGHRLRITIKNIDEAHLNIPKHNLIREVENMSQKIVYN